MFSTLGTCPPQLVTYPSLLIAQKTQPSYNPSKTNADLLFSSPSYTY